VAASTAAVQAGVGLDHSLLEALEAAREFRSRRQRLQEEQIGRLAAELPLHQIRVHFLFADAIGPVEIDELSRSLGAGIEALPDPADVSV